MGDCIERCMVGDDASLILAYFLYYHSANQYDWYHSGVETPSLSDTSEHWEFAIEDVYEEKIQKTFLP